MFDIGFWEILLISCISLIVIGPEKLPQVAKFCGKTVAKIRLLSQELRFLIEHEIKLDDLRKEIEKNKSLVEKSLIDEQSKSK